MEELGRREAAYEEGRLKDGIPPSNYDLQLEIYLGQST